MISPKIFYDLLVKNGIGFFSGVPDSLLKDFSAYITDNAKSNSHIIAANEGGAVALATGYHLATKKIGLIYMQNSGQGNAVNPLVSLADPEVYGIPMLLLIGWRGEPGVKDEPQHIKQGRITPEILKALGISFEILPSSLDDARKAVKKAIVYMNKFRAPYALVVRSGTFAPYAPKKPVQPLNLPLSREEAIEIITDELRGDEIFISTTGKTSRELFEVRENSGQSHQKDFLTVGSMGHSSQIALGMALAKPESQVYCLDGDGALIMHMGALAVIGNAAPENFKHIVLNNYAYESVGGQPTAAFSMDIPQVARACGYKNVFRVSEAGKLRDVIADFKRMPGPALLEVAVKTGSRDNLGRPTLNQKENKNLFMDFVSRGSQNLLAAEGLKKFFEKNGARRVFLVTGGKSYITSGAERMFHKVLLSYEITKFSDFSSSPKLEDAERGINIFRKKKYDVVVAIGGGSVIDMAKLINILSVQDGLPIDYISGRKKITKNGKLLIAIPTTAGSGSEATHFAVVYAEGKKYSIAHESILPAAVIIEPLLTMNMPVRLAAASGMDALSQAIESYWCVNATDVSKHLAERAIRLILGNLVQSVKNPNLESRSAMALASHLAGKAINITKTTAPHAISYFFTSRFGIPHGHAVALTLGKIFVYNSHINSKTMAELSRLLGVANAGTTARKINNIMEQIGLETRLSKLGVRQNDIDSAVKSVNAERLKNNPRKMTENNIREILLSIL
ncbi:MAG: phosphonopyruvate decarboxylase [Parcubacteria group bacterium]|nr:phosphonopyruvate decarboxylase [Parcubacteria group bacterium]